MRNNRIAIIALLACLGVGTWAADLYFGGYGDTNTHWTGYSAELTGNGLTNWNAYTLSESGTVAVAPATFHRMGTNKWTALFDEHVFTTNGGVVGLARHDLTVRSIQNGRMIVLRDAHTNVTLNKISEDDLKRMQK